MLLPKAAILHNGLLTGTDGTSDSALMPQKTLLLCKSSFLNSTNSLKINMQRTILE